MAPPRNTAPVRTTPRPISRDLDQVTYAGTHNGGATEVRQAGLLDSANDRIGALTERLAASNKYLGMEFDRVLGSVPETGADGPDTRSTSDGTAHELHSRLTVLERAAESLMNTATRAREL